METKREHSWFWKWVANNKLVSILSVILLGLMIIFMVNKVSWFFQPFLEFLTIIAAPILVSGILYYLLNPIVDWLERKFHVKRTLSIVILFVIVVALAAWGIVNLVPEVQHQFHTLSENIPKYLEMLTTTLDQWFKQANLKELNTQFDKMNKDIVNQLGKMGKNIFTHGFSGISSMVSVMVSIVVTVITVPFILFYLLRDGKKLVPFITQYLPTKMRKSLVDVLSDINQKVSSYIRGQILVAISVAIIYMIGFSIIKLDYGIAFGVMAGFFNIIPYLGSWLTMVPVIIITFVVGGPIMVIKVLIVHVIEQLIESHVLDPIVIGGQMEIHPLTIIFVLLTAGRLFGVLGVILGIPGYATIKVIIVHLYRWYRDSHPELFKENTLQE